MVIHFTSWGFTSLTTSPGYIVKRNNWKKVLLVACLSASKKYGWLEMWLEISNCPCFKCLVSPRQQLKQVKVAPVYSLGFLKQRELECLSKQGKGEANDFLGGGDNRPESFPVCFCAAGIPHTCSRTPANWSTQSFSTCPGTPSELATFLQFTTWTVPHLMSLHRKGDTAVC